MGAHLDWGIGNFLNTCDFLIGGGGGKRVGNPSWETLYLQTNSVVVK